MKKIVLLEPDKLLASTYKQALKQDGFSVSTVSDAQMAVHQIDSDRPDGIIMELQLHGHNGVEFLHELRSYYDWTDIPIVVLSQVPPTDIGLSQENYQKMGIARLLYKPRTSLKRLTQVMREVIA